MAVQVVTGGAGFIGSHIVGALAERGDRVIVLDNFSTGKLGNLSAWGDSIEIRELDIARDTNLSHHLVGVDTVFHEAAIPSVPRSLSDPITCHDANLTATLNLLDAARKAGVRRVVYASSSAVYGDGSSLPKTEASLAAPVSPYGSQKYFGEIYARIFWQTFGLEIVSLRYFNVFGPRQDAGSPYSGVVARFIPALLEGRAPTIYGDGQQSRDFIYVADVVEANLVAGQTPGVAGCVFNIATGQSVTVNAVLEESLRLTGMELAPIHEPQRPGDILHSRADISRARELLGWSSKVGLREGLQATLAWYQSII